MSGLLASAFVIFFFLLRGIVVLPRCPAWDRLPGPVFAAQDLSKRSINRVDVDKDAFLRLFPLPGLLGGAWVTAPP